MGRQHRGPGPSPLCIAETVLYPNCQCLKNSHRFVSDASLVRRLDRRQGLLFGIVSLLGRLDLLKEAAYPV
jgi:hypothetical protein